MEHPPGWSKFEELQTLDVIDEFFDTQTACEADGKDLKERLNFKLEAGGVVSGGGVYTVDLTDATGAALDGTTLTFALDAAEFGEDHFSRDYSYYITYTMCGFVVVLMRRAPRTEILLMSMVLRCSVWYREVGTAALTETASPAVPLACKRLKPATYVSVKI